MKKSLVAAVIVVVLLVVAGVWWWHRDHARDNHHLVLDGNVDIRQISLAFDGSGRVLQLRAEEGDTVKAGQVLAVLDTRTLALEAAQAQAQIDVQQQNLLRLQHGSRPQELAQPALADHVEADGRLVQEQDLGVVQQRGHDVAAHPLAQAQLPHGGVEQRAEPDPRGRPRLPASRDGRLRRPRRPHGDDA